jgi:ATP-binding cassette, subfamily B, bacterial
MARSADTVGASDPFTYDELSERRARKPVRELPHLVARAVRLVRDAAPRWARRSVGLDLAGALIAAGQLVVAQRLIAAMSSLGAAGRSFGTVVWPLAAFAVLLAIGAAVGVVQVEVRRILGETVAKVALGQVARVAADAPLVDFDRPGFHDRLQRALANAGMRPIQVTNALIGIASGLLTSVGVMIGLAFVQPVLVGFVLVTFVPVWIATRRVTRLAFRFDVDETASDRRRGYLLSLLTGRDHAKEVRAFGLAEHLGGEHERMWQERLGRMSDIAKQKVRIGIAARVLNAATVAGVIAVLAWLVADGRVSLADAAVAAAAVLVLGGRLATVVSGFGLLYESSLFLREVDDFLGAGARRREALVAGDEAPPLTELAVESVTFSYPAAVDRPAALSEVSMRVARGEVVALVGANGSGKTTLAKLLAGLYEPESGAVTWNGTAVGELSLPSRLRRVAVIFQDFGRYFASAAENVWFGDVHRPLDREQVQTSIDEAGASFLLDLPQGVDTALGPEFWGGHDLSLGQWQRVAIARAFFRDADLVILDEPSAALDAEAESALFERLRVLCAGRAVVVISHRFSTVRSADRIYVLDEGRVVEEGSHTTLLAQDGRYARMFRLQAEAYSE